MLGATVKMRPKITIFNIKPNSWENEEKSYTECFLSDLWFKF